jgi:hypothetical protein
VRHEDEATRAGGPGKRPANTEVTFGQS